MGKKLLGLFIVFMLSAGMEVEISNPVEVEVVSSTGKLKGEILSVRQSTLVLVSPVGVEEKDIVSNKTKVFVVENDLIESIQKVGRSYRLLGSLGGCLLGCVTGYVIGEHDQNETEKKGGVDLFHGREGEVLALGLGGCGAFVGGMIGAAMSGKDSLCISPEHRDFTALKALARYPSEEPDFLKGIGK